MSVQVELITPDQPELVERSAAAGGKAVGLARLVKLGLTVPRFCVLPAGVLSDCLRSGGHATRVSELLNSAATNNDLSSISSELQQIVLGLEVSPTWAEQLLGSLSANSLLAVRSSAIGEDAADASFAGIHESQLFVPRDKLLTAVRQVWASAFSQRALTYRQQQGLSMVEIAIGVVIQEMIDAEVSGIGFSADPVTGNPDAVVINAAPGCGEGLVSGGLEGDEFRVQRSKDRAITANLAAKSHKVVANSTGGTQMVELPVEQQAVACLSDPQVLQVASAIEKIEASEGLPQDVEFCFDRAGQFWMLQARPMTTPVAAMPDAGNRIVWDNSNIIESYSGVTSAMTFSFIRVAYASVYESFAQVMGVRRAVVESHRPVFRNMLGLIRGRVYYNLVNWHRLIKLFPGYRVNRKFMESMMGVREPLEEDKPTPARGVLKKLFVDLPSLVMVTGRMLWNFARIRSVADRFNRHFDSHFDRWTKQDLNQLKPHQLMELYKEMESKLLWNWRAPIINDFYTMIYHGLLRKRCKDWCGEEGEALANELFTGIGGVASTGPSDDLLRMTELVRADNQLQQMLQDTSPEQLAKSQDALAGFPAFYSAYREYLNRWGYRCTGELKLEELTLREDPTFIFQVIQNHLRSGTAQPSPEVREQTEQQRRTEAESRALSSITGVLGWFRRRHFMWVLRNARVGVRQREHMRYQRTRIFGLVRDLLNAMGQRLAEARAIDNPRDIFHLKLEEVWDIIGGTAESCDLKSLVESRRAEFDRYRDLPDPPARIVTYGMVGAENNCRFTPQVIAPIEGGLTGTPCSPGKVTGIVRLLSDPRQGAELQGEILVARRTDPGWVALYPSISGLLVERGSVLSHSAIVAREMGIPAVVGIHGLFETLKDGMRVSMDGTTGRIELLD